jgi:hypothetical protein
MKFTLWAANNRDVVRLARGRPPTTNLVLVLLKDKFTLWAANNRAVIRLARGRHSQGIEW